MCWIPFCQTVTQHHWSHGDHTKRGNGLGYSVATTHHEEQLEVSSQRSFLPDTIAGFTTLCSQGGGNCHYWSCLTFWAKFVSQGGTPTQKL